MTGLAYIFINYKQAAALGHIGWGFQLDNKRFLFGSTDHLIRHEWWDFGAWLNYLDVPQEGFTDWWAEQGALEKMLDMMTGGHHIRYHHYKVLAIENANPSRAEEAALTTREMGWSVLENNCVHQTYKIISAYGGSTHMADPCIDLFSRVPKFWFQSLKGELGVLRDPRSPGL